MDHLGMVDGKLGFHGQQHADPATHADPVGPQGFQIPFKVWYLLAAVILSFLLSVLLNARLRPHAKNGPPRLRETIPYVSNAWQYMTDKKTFIARSSEMLRTNPVIQCQIGPLKVFLISGSSNVSTLFRPSFSSDDWVALILRNACGFHPRDAAKFSGGRSGSHKDARAGHEQQSFERPLVASLRQVYHEHLLASHNATAFGHQYQALFDKQLTDGRGPGVGDVGKWVDCRVVDFLRRHMASAATVAVFGQRFVDVNPDIVAVFWEFEKHAEALAFGLPQWMNKSGVKARDRINRTCREWVGLLRERRGSDHEGDFEKDSAWNHTYGSPVCRNLAKLERDYDLSEESIAAFYVALLIGLHANSIIICAWVMIELIKDPPLLLAAKAEAAQALVETSSGRTLDVQKLVSMPLLQALQHEALRLHVSLLLTRTAVEPVTLAGQDFPPGSTFQTPTEALHRNEDFWATPESPATEFNPHRHLERVETDDEGGSGGQQQQVRFVPRSQKGAFVPYGGGAPMCPGRLIAKTEIVVTVAMLLLRFEMDLASLQWLNQDGSPSSRPAQDQDSYINSVATPPDRELKMRWRRIG